jgi:hypothetical protein
MQKLENQPVLSCARLSLKPVLKFIRSFNREGALPSPSAAVPAAVRRKGKGGVGWMRGSGAGVWSGLCWLRVGACGDPPSMACFSAQSVRPMSPFTLGVARRGRNGRKSSAGRRCAQTHPNPHPRGWLV